VIMVTHDPRAAAHARHTLHLDKGRLLEAADAPAADAPAAESRT